MVKRILALLAFYVVIAIPCSAMDSVMFPNDDEGVSFQFGPLKQASDRGEQRAEKLFTYVSEARDQFRGEVDTVHRLPEGIVQRDLDLPVWGENSLVAKIDELERKSELFRDEMERESELFQDDSARISFSCSELKKAENQKRAGNLCRFLAHREFQLDESNQNIITLPEEISAKDLDNIEELFMKAGRSKKKVDVALYGCIKRGSKFDHLRNLHEKVKTMVPDDDLAKNTNLLSEYNCSEKGNEIQDRLADCLAHRCNNLLDEIRQKGEEFNRHKEESERNAAEAQERINGCLREIKEKDDNCLRVSTIMASANRALEEERTRMREQIESLENQKRSSEENSTQLRDRINSLESEIASVRENHSKYEEKHQRLVNSMRDLLGDQ